MSDDKRNKPECPIATDIKASLSEIAAALRSKSRKKKLNPVKQSLLDKGFDMDKEKRKTKQSSKYRYPTHLQRMNDARSEAARQKRLQNPQYSEVIKESLNAAEKIIQDKRKEQQRLLELQRYNSRPVRAYKPFKKNPYEFNSEPDYVEVRISTHSDTPVFKNKVEEAIYRLKNKK